jgi:hypothetical protein
MICVSLGNIGFNRCVESLLKVECAEIRLDLMDLTEDEVDLYVFGTLHIGCHVSSRVNIPRRSGYAYFTRAIQIWGTVCGCRNGS